VSAANSRRHYRHDPARRRMPIEEWPEPDRLAWERATSTRRLRTGAAYNWRVDTKKKVAKAWGRLLTFLEQCGDLDRAAAPETRVAEEGRLAAWLDEMQQQQLAPLTIRGLVLDIAEALRVMAPTYDGAWLYELQQRLADEAHPVRDKRRLLRHPRELLDLGVATMEQAPERTYREQDHWLAEYRDGAMVAFLAARPLRARTFWQLRYGTELRRDELGYVIDVEDELLKTGGYWTARLPDVLTPWFDRYFDEVRPQMLRGRETDRVWVTTDGTVMSERMVYIRVRKFTLRELGVAMNLHVFRDCMMTAIARFDPRNVRMGQFMLQHRSPKSGTAFYNLAGMIEAVLRCQDTITDLRRHTADAAVRRDRRERQRRPPTRT